VRRAFIEFSDRKVAEHPVDSTSNKESQEEARGLLCNCSGTNDLGHYRVMFSILVRIS
jgi:hypothetical protein